MTPKKPEAGKIGAFIGTNTTPPPALEKLDEAALDRLVKIVQESNRILEREGYDSTSSDT